MLRQTECDSSRSRTSSKELLCSSAALDAIASIRQRRHSTEGGTHLLPPLLVDLVRLVDLVNGPKMFAALLIEEDGLEDVLINRRLLVALMVHTGPNLSARLVLLQSGFDCVLRRSQGVLG